MSGLQFPDDLGAWQRWSQRQQGALGALRRARGRLRPAAPTPAWLWLPPGQPRALVVIDNLSPSCRLVIRDPLAHARLDQVAVLTSITDPGLPSQDWTVEEFTGPHLIPASVEQVLSLGAFNTLSGGVEQWARGRDIRFCVVQHGLMTPWAPPLNEGCHLLAWSQADALFWGAGRASITWQVVGPQLLWEAATAPAGPLVSERPVMLGQLHGLELPRRQKLEVYRRFCAEHRGDYRPHPVETDVVSRLGHAWLRARGVGFETSGAALVELGRPVVSIFSTGSLEAAQRGVPAWVHHPNPPAWVRDFWQRYGLHEYGEDPTPAWPLGEVAPAELIARAIGV